MTKAYHVVFLILCVAGFVFAVICASAGIYIILQRPDAATAGIVVESVSALGFFFARWSQKEFRYLLKEAAKSDALNLLASSRFTQEDVEVFREFMGMVLPTSVNRQAQLEEVTNDL